MELKNIFKMTKTDRYTQDGRDELAKLQETEDVKYKTGDISQKTGLQKQPDGSWAPPKGGKKKTGQEKKSSTSTRIDTSAAQDKLEELTKNKASFEERNKVAEQIKAANEYNYLVENLEKRGDKPTEEMQKKLVELKAKAESKPGRDYPVLKNKDHVDLAKEVKSNTMPGSDWTAEEIAKEWKLGKADAEEVKKEFDKIKESKPAAQEVKLGGGADTYYFEDPDNMSNEDKVFKSLGIELAETFGDHDGDPGNTETWANGWLDNIMDNGGLGIKSKKTRQPAAPVPAEEVMRIVEENPARWNRIIGNAKKFYEGKGSSTDFESDESYPIKLLGGKTKPSAQYYAEGKRNEKNNPLTGKYVTQRQNTSKDAAPRELTGDCKIRIRPETQDKVYQIGEISQKTGLQKTANGWRPVKKNGAAAGSAEKTAASFPSHSGMDAEQYDKKLRQEGWKQTGEYSKNAAGHNVGYFEKNGKRIQVVENSEGRIAGVDEVKPKTEAKPGSYPGWKPNDVIYYKGSNDDPRPYKIAGTQFWFKTPEEAMTAVVAGTRGEGKTYAKPSSDVTINEIQNALGFKLDSEYAGKYSMDDFMKKTGENEYGVHVWSFGTNSKGTLIDTIVEGYNKPNATIRKENGEWKLHYKDRDGKEGIWTATGREFPTGDAAPRQLTGDSKIRIRK